MRVREWFARLGRLSGHVEDALLVLLLSVMIVMAVAQILLRNFLDMGLVWVDPLLRALVLWVAMLGAMAASRSDNHIGIDLLSRYLPARLRTVAGMLAALATAVICAALAYYSARLVSLDRAAQAMAFGPVPAWLVESVLPFGFTMIALRYLVVTGRRLERLAVRRERRP